MNVDNTMKIDALSFHTPGINTNNDSVTKRYCISQDVKDNFYAIHHIQRLNKENITEGNENIEPIKTPMTNNRKINNRGRKRIAPDNNNQQTTIFTPIISNTTAIAPISQIDIVKRKKPRQQSKSKKEHYSLYQTCQQIWPESSSLGDLTYDRVKSLGELLKMRLNQAKFKMMARLDKDNELFSILAEEYLALKPKKHFTLSFNNNDRLKSNRSTMVVIGNGKHLFSRQQQKSQRRHSINMSSMLESIFESPTTPNDDKMTSPQRNSKTPTKDRKKKMSKGMVIKPKRVTTPKRRSAAADVVPVVLSDGSSVYVCEPCNKKYKNRNGLAYHLERCKNAKSTTNNSSNEEEKPSSQPEQHSNNIDCICSQANDENTAMIQCEKCRHWSHADCVGISEDKLEESFCCSKCKEQINPDLSETKDVERDLLQCLLEQANQEQQQQTQSPNETTTYPAVLSQEQQDQLNQLKELLNQPVIPNKQEDHPEEDELFSMPTTNADDEPLEFDPSVPNEAFDSMNDSSQLHIWDDFNVHNTQTFDKTATSTEQQPVWNLMEDEEAFSSYDTDTMQSSTWNMSDLNMFSAAAPPSLLFTENTMDSALDEDALPLIGDLSESTPTASATVSSCGPPQNTEGLWFQFANFDNDYHCENESQNTPVPL